MEIASERHPLSHPETALSAENAAAGIPAHGEGASALAPTPRAGIDRAVAELQARKDAWVGVSIAGRRALLKRLRRSWIGLARCRRQGFEIGGDGAKQSHGAHAADEAANLAAGQKRWGRRRLQSKPVNLQDIEI